ncbi:IS4 family transposase [Gracilibacillus phocaeensis]|uniref:IS4 family transposase n=1 Tax=Gracilibacillus phocaeensis TaxID=2042304 RepID=UPI001030B6A0|nr:transposase [Gracilibacillus phocaeensis]
MSTILPNSNENEKSNSRMLQFFTQAKIGTFLNQAHVHKEKGFSPRLIMQFIFALVLHGMSFSRALESERVSKDFEKDTVYEFLKNPTYNWRKFLSNVGSNLVMKFLLPLTSEDRDRVLIFDDSLFSRNRSKAVELLARVKDHTTGRYFKGFRMLTLGWSDGASFMPLAFSLLSSKNEKNRFQDVDSNIDKRTVGYKRRQEATKKSTETMFDLLDSINPNKLGAKTVLFDSWFAYPAIISKIIKNYSLDVVCMIKRSPKIHYTYEGESYTLNQLYKKVRKKRGRAKILANIVVGLRHDDKNGNEIQARIVFVRDRNRSKQWLALLTTNLEHTEEDAIRIYGKRWEIECFFRVVKSNLRLAKEFQCRSYDSMTAHTTIVFLRYMMLSLSVREEEDHRTIGQLFYVCCDEIEDIRFAQALMTILELIGSTMVEEYLLTDEQINEFFNRFFRKLPDYLRKSLLHTDVA